MHIGEVETPALKKWVVKRLEDISDADSDVLADYVLALIKSDDSDEQVRSNCLENLEDFLRNNTATFVEEIFKVIALKSYLPTTQPSIASETVAATTANDDAAVVGGPSSGPSGGPSGGPSAVNGTGDAFASRQTKSDTSQASPGRRSADHPRKRTHEEHRAGDSADYRDPHYGNAGPADRSMKQMRRGGRAGSLANSHRNRAGFHGNHNINKQNNDNFPFPHMGPLPTGAMQSPMLNLPPLDPNDPLAAIMAMQAMGFPPLPGMPGMPGFGIGDPSSSPLGNTMTGPFDAPVLSLPLPGSSDRKTRRERCRDYDTKGFCALGSACTFEHGTDHIIVSGQSEEYDPTNAILDLQKSGADHASAGRRRGTDRGRGRGRGRGDRGGQPHGRGGRAPFSHAGPNNDRSSSSVVVEQIPEEKFDDESVRGFFSSFGSIAEVTLQAYKRLAVVKFEDHDSAKRAYESPKVIFDNRFVKVYWYKPDSLPIPVNGKDDRASSAAPLKADHEMIDVAEFERKQVEAQKAHEEKAAKLKEAQTQREALDQKLKAQAEERKKLLDKLAAKTQKSAKVEAAENTAGNDGETRTDEGQKQSSQTEALKTKLAELEAEAQSMGINPEEPWSGTGRGRGRGGSSSYGGGFYGRGRGYDSSRGASRGRSALHHAALRGGAVKRLDNRTKRVAVSGIEYGTEKDEALRQFLFNNYEVDNIETDPDRKETQIISFKERYVAENFIASSNDVPSLGKLEVAWITKDLPAISTAANSSPKSANGHDTAMAEPVEHTATAKPSTEVDCDVADDEDRWMAS